MKEYTAKEIRGKLTEAMGLAQAGEVIHVTKGDKVYELKSLNFSENVSISGQKSLNSAKSLNSGKLSGDDLTFCQGGLQTYNTPTAIASKLAEVITRKIAAGEYGVQNEAARRVNFTPSWWNLVTE